MKQTEIERKEREIKQALKKEERLSKRTSCKEGMTVGDYIDHLETLFFHDDKKIYNLKSDIRILECMEDIKCSIPEKQWDNVIRKAVKKSGISEREPAIAELLGLLGQN